MNIYIKLHYRVNSLTALVILRRMSKRMLCCLLQISLENFIRNSGKMTMEMMMEMTMEMMIMTVKMTMKMMISGSIRCICVYVRV